MSNENYKKKIIIVNDFLEGGGVEKLMLDLVWAWHDKYDITMLTDELNPNFHKLYPDNVKYLSQNDPRKIKNKYLGKIYNKTFRRLYRKHTKAVIKNANFDIAIAIKEGFKMWDVDNFVPAKKKFCWNHTDYNSYYYTQGIFKSADVEREMMKRFDKIVCVSEDIKKGICDVIGNPGNLTVCYNPIDIENVIEKAKEPVVDIDSMELPEEKRPVRFVTVGRLNMQKGFDLLLEAVHMLELEGYKFEVLVVGGQEPWGGECYRLYDQAKRLKVQNLKFIGGRSNPYKYMAIADWFLSSSIFEGYSLVSQEAAVLDVPLLLTKCSGVRELLGENDEFGISMEPSVIGIYNGMKRVLDNPQLQQQYKEKIIERKKIITYQERIAEIENLFN